MIPEGSVCSAAQGGGGGGQRVRSGKTLRNGKGA